MENKITIYRGSHQIGGCATEICAQENRIIIDFGANLPDAYKEDSITDEELVKAVFDGRRCDGVLFTHYHGDHVGLYKKIPPDIPLYIGPAAKRVLEILAGRLDHIPGMLEKGLPRISGMQCYARKEQMDFGNIRVTPFSTDHSAVDAYMFLIKAGGKKILFTGDFRDHGIAGEHGRLERTIQKYIGEVDILITEGTMLSRIPEARQSLVRTERDLGRRARELFLANKESVILVSSTNLDSIMEFYHNLPDQMGFVCDAYQVAVMLAAMDEKRDEYGLYREHYINGKPRPINLLRPMEGLGAGDNCYEADFHRLKKTGFTMLVREGNPVFQKVMKYFDDPLVIYSKWTGYLGGTHENAKIKELIGSRRMEILHTSGHAHVETIGKLICLTNPKVIIPMHTQCADGFRDVPAFAPYRGRVRVLQDGEGYCF